MNNSQELSPKEIQETIRQTEKFIDEGIQANIFAERAIFFIGFTGAGKTTCTNYFAKIPLVSIENKFGNIRIGVD